MRNVVGTIYGDENFAELSEVCGRPAIAPWRLALVMVTDRKLGLCPSIRPRFPSDNGQAASAAVDDGYPLWPGLEEKLGRPRGRDEAVRLNLRGWRAAQCFGTPSVPPRVKHRLHASADRARRLNRLGHEFRS